MCLFGAEMVMPVSFFSTIVTWEAMYSRWHMYMIADEHAKQIWPYLTKIEIAILK